MHQLQLIRRLRRLVPVAFQLRIERVRPDLERVEFGHGMVFEVEPILAHMIREERTGAAEAIRAAQRARDAALAALTEAQETSAVAVEAARREAASEQARAAGLERQLRESAAENAVLLAERDAFCAAFTGERDQRNAAEVLRDLKPVGRA